MVSTDQYYFTCATLGLPGMMVTASHNPKLTMVSRWCAHALFAQRRCRHPGYPPTGGDGSIHRTNAARPGNSTRFSGRFITKVLSIIEISALRPLKVVVDTGNGMVGPILKEVFRPLPVQLIGLYLEPDGNLPNHGLDPLQPENRAELQARVVTEQADIGFAFDGMATASSPLTIAVSLYPEIF